MENITKYSADSADKAQRAFAGKNVSRSLTIHRDYCCRCSDVLQLRS